MAFWVPLAIAAGTFLLGRLFRPKIPKQTPPTFEVPSIEEGIALPIVYGTEPVNPTVIWWGDAQTFEGEQDNIPFVDYYAKIVFAICEGPIDGLADISIGEKSLSLLPTGSVDMTTSQGFPMAVFDEDTPTTNIIRANDLFGGFRQEGGVAGICTVYWGGLDQPIDDTYSAAFSDPTDASGLPRVVYAAFTGSEVFSYPAEISEQGFYWSSNVAQPKPVTFIVQRFPVPTGFSAGTARIRNNCNPAHALYDILTDERLGAGIPTTRLNLTSFTTAATTLYNEGLGLSFQVQRQTPVEDVIEDVLRHIDGTLYRDPITGLVNLALARGDYAGSTLAVFGNHNAKLVKVTRPLGVADVNEVKVRYRKYRSAAGTGTVTDEVLSPLTLIVSSYFGFTEGKNISDVTVENVTQGWSVGPLTEGVWASANGVDEAVLLFSSEFGRLQFSTADDVYDDGDVIHISYISADTLGQAGYVPAAEQFQNLASQMGSGEVRPETYDYPMYTEVVHAASRAALLARISDASLDEVTLVTNRDAYNLRPGSVIMVDFAEENIAELVCRVVDVDFSRLDEDEITVTCVEDVYQTPLDIQLGNGSGGQAGPPQALQAPDIAALYCLMGGITLGVQPGNTALTMEAEVGSASGTATTSFTVTAGATTFTYSATGTLWFRIRHPVQSIYTVAGDWTPWVSCASSTATGTTTCVLPTYSVGTSTNSGSTTGTVTLTVTDAQVRVQLVEFRTRSGNGLWSSWASDTSPYEATVALSATEDSEVQWRISYLDCSGVLQRLENAFVFAFDATDTPPGGIGSASDLVRIVDGAGHILAIPAVPSALTEPADGDGNLSLRFRKVIGDPDREFRAVRIVARVAVGFAGASGTKLALQASIGGGGFDYADGVSGPVVEVDTEGEVLSHSVTIDPAFFGDTVFRFVTLDGDGTTDVGFAYIDAEFITSGTEVELPDTDAPRCELDATGLSNSFEGYADTAALLAAWPETDTVGYLTPTLSTEQATDGTKAIKLVFAGTTSAPNADAYVSRTLTGFSPGESVRLVLAMRSSNVDTNDDANHIGITTNGVLAKRLTSHPADTWFDLTAECEADGSGNVAVRIGASSMTFLIAATFTVYCDHLRVYRNCP